MTHSDEEATEVLRKAEEDLQPLVNHFGLTYRDIKLSHNKSIYGRLTDSGRILINPFKKDGTLRKYSVIIETLIHELAHTKFAGHRKGTYGRVYKKLVTWAKEKEIYQPRQTRKRAED